ncbi:MAG: hypothetical protein KAT05_10030, partial [Spirochaetes bacterium]|nr:hypothetical protein [Spirochaetota bacterium]
MFSTYDINYSNFNEFIKDFANKLKYPINEFSINKKEYPYETELFVYYTARYNDINNNQVRLSVEIVKNPKTNNIIEARYSIDLGFYDTPVLFNFYHKMGDTDYPYILIRWLFDCLNKINAYKVTPFEYYFSDFPYLKYGIRGISDTTAYLFKVTLSGILNINHDKQVWIARIRHIRKDDLYRSFSYAILPYGEIDWLIFPDAVGLDSGG